MERIALKGQVRYSAARTWRKGSALTVHDSRYDEAHNVSNCDLPNVFQDIDGIDIFGISIFLRCGRHGRRRGGIVNMGSSSKVVGIYNTSSETLKI